MDDIKKIFKIATIFSACLAIGFGNITAFAEEGKNITLLGDSITTGFGLSEEELSYGAYLDLYYDAEVDNFAVNGQTTGELLETLEEYEIRSSLEQSDLVCISIGGNDFLSIFEKAYSEIGDGINISDGNVSVSSEFVSKFVMDYSSAFGTAAVNAGENIKKVVAEVEEINPDAQIIIQTVYNPLESENAEKNEVMKPLKTFLSLYLGTINNSIKEASPMTADIYLKFSEKPYLYTNIESYDIHPNAIGHLLIAEEIVQTLAETGNSSIFTDTIYNIPQGIFSKFPQYTANELSTFAEGSLRRGTLEQSIARDASATADSVDSTEISETEEKKVTAENVSPEKKEEKKEESKVKDILSRVFLVLGMAIILAVTFKRYVSKRNKKR